MALRRFAKPLRALQLSLIYRQNSWKNQTGCALQSVSGASLPVTVLMSPQGQILAPNKTPTTLAQDVDDPVQDHPVILALWPPPLLGQMRALMGKTLLVLGLGDAGQAIAAHATPFGFR